MRYGAEEGLVGEEELQVGASVCRMSIVDLPGLVSVIKGSDIRFVLENI